MSGARVASGSPYSVPRTAETSSMGGVSDMLKKNPEMLDSFRTARMQSTPFQESALTLLEHSDSSTTGGVDSINTFKPPNLRSHSKGVFAPERASSVYPFSLDSDMREIDSFMLRREKTIDSIKLFLKRHRLLILCILVTVCVLAIVLIV